MAKRQPTVRARVKLEGLGHIEYDVLAETVPLSDGLEVPPELFVTFPSDRESPSLEMTLAVVDGLPSCRDLRINAKDGRRGVRSGDLAGVRLEDWIEDLFAVVVQHVDEDGSRQIRTLSEDDVAQAAKAVRAARRGARRRISESQLAEVAEVYRDNVASAPTKAVADRFAVSHRTASYYVSKARAAGLLPPTSRGRKDA